MLAPWFLLLLTCPGQDEADAFQEGLERVRRLEDKNQWSRAREELDVLLEEHRERDYVLHRLPEVREEVKRISFWLTYEPPDPDDLTSGELLKYSPSTGQIKIRYRTKETVEESLSDFRFAGEGFHHPLYFDGPYSITLKGDELDDELAVAAGTLEQGRITAFLNSKGKPAMLGLRRGEFYNKLLDHNDKVSVRTGKPYEVKLAVRNGRVSVTYNRKSLLKAKDIEELVGRLSFWGPLPDEILIEGKATTAWIEGLVSEAMDADRSRFEEEFDPKTVLPDWLLAMNKEAVIPFRPPYPDAKNKAHLTTWAEVEDLVAEEKYGAARRLLRALEEDRVTEAFRAYALAYVDFEDGRQDDALSGLERVRELEPGFSGARVLEASIHLDQGNRKRALEILEEVTLDDPLEVSAWIWLIQIEMYADTERAKATLDRALRAGIPPATLARLNKTLVRAQQGPRWGQIFERESKHYRVASNLNLSICVEATKILEEALQLYRKDFPRLASQATKRRRYPVYLFTGKAGYLAYVGDVGHEKPESTAGVYMSDLKQLLIWNLPEREQMVRTIRHEGFHQYLDSVIPAAPAWLHEGLAGYYEISDPSRGFREAGRPHETYLGRLFSRSAKWTPFEDLLHMSNREFMRSASLHYPQAWGLAQFLMQSDPEERKRLDDYMDALARGHTWSQAAESILDGRDGEAFHKQVRAYLVELDR